MSRPAVDAGNIVGNVYDKYGTRNPIARALMRGFTGAVTDLYLGTGARSVLEVGCGEGRLAHHLIQAARPARFEACDVELRPAPDREVQAGPRGRAVGQEEGPGLDRAEPRRVGDGLPEPREHDREQGTASPGDNGDDYQLETRSLHASTITQIALTVEGPHHPPLTRRASPWPARAKAPATRASLHR